MKFELEKVLHGVFHTALGVSEKVVLIYALINWNDQEFEIALETWAAGAGVSRATMRRALDALLAGEYVKQLSMSGYHRVKDEDGQPFSKHYPARYKVLIKNLK